MKFHRQDRKVVLIIDKYSANPRNEILKAVGLVYVALLPHQNSINESEGIKRVLLLIVVKCQIKFIDAVK